MAIKQRKQKPRIGFEKSIDSPSFQKDRGKRFEKDGARSLPQAARTFKQVQRALSSRVARRAAAGK
jgi:hypothetical protein